MTPAIRTASDPLSALDAVRDTDRSLDRDQPIYRIRTMDELMAGALAPTRFTLLILVIFAAVAAMLAVVGIYGVMSHAVEQRTHEIGVWMALGAQVSDLLRMVVGNGIKPVAFGVGSGLLGSFLLTRLIGTLLYNVSASDTSTFVEVSAMLAGVALGACFVPARRAARVDPMVALRYE